MHAGRVCFFLCLILLRSFVAQNETKRTWQSTIDSAQRTKSNVVQHENINAKQEVDPFSLFPVIDIFTCNMKMQVNSIMLQCNAGYTMRCVMHYIHCEKQ